ncbi:fibronectin type III domain-containing protein [Flavobacterium paronense]|uniref:Fibronectin type III domain-containing protein n=1 Tax=Flavobacterium paronense TaxID=1392775 RepID=A0ABV5GF05_9FLAO|nr:fibronectin type III domain-containing protein [Flavobacterium paronense]MDN3678531.1 fibronectin type III domain-containing protein [Flavobacterium paronense]
MKKFTLLLLFLFISISSYSQLSLEGFENTTGPDASPSTNWTLGTGNWAVFDNAVGPNVRWGINNTVATPPIVYQGTNAAYVNRGENIGQGNTSEDYLATPLVQIPANGVLHFYTRMFTSGNQGTIYQIKVAPALASQTDPLAYSLAQQWTEDELITPTSNFNIYTEKTVDLGTSFGGQFVYVAFVKVYTQPSTSIDGDRWLIDDVSIDTPCLVPTGLTVSAITANGATLNWTNPNGTGAASWEIEVVLASGTPTGIPTNTTTTFPYVVTGLLPNTAYKFYVRARCTTGFTSPWSVASANFTTLVGPPVCGGNFVDSGGITGNYPNNANVTTTICPTNPGDLVTVTFTSFNTENGVDLLKVYDGNSAAAPLLATLSGTTLPPSFTASNALGCLTFVFTSNGSTRAAGWVSNITCNAPPTCRKPTALASGTITINSVILNWSQPQNPDTSVATAWEVLALPCGSPAPTAVSTGFVPAGSNPFTLTGLTSATCYDIYVRAVCSLTDSSAWSVPTTITTLLAPPVCGGNFVDTGGLAANYPNNANQTTTICPVTVGDVVTVTFTSFNTQANTDFLKIYDGNSTSGTLLANLSGTTLPPSFTASNALGCLTFVFTSNGTTTAAGWTSNITCTPAPACPKPVVLTTAGLSPTSVSFGWTGTGTATSWQVLALPCTDPAPTNSTTGWTPVTTNSYIFTGLTTGTCYNFYVRSDCGGISGLSEWAGPQTFTTAVPGFTCAAPIVVTTLPYTTSDNTSNYADNAPIEGSPGASGCGSTNNYLNGNDVVYSFTSTFTGTINVAMTPTATYSGIFAYSSCANIGVNCLAGVANSGTGIRSFDLPVTAGSTYYFVISTWAAPQTTAYTLVINQINCGQPTNATVASITSDSALASWDNPSASTSWQVAVQPAGTGVPSGSGVTSTSNTNFPLTGLTPLTSYEYYVRADCGNGTFSLWTGPVPFTTAAPPPVCGGIYVDSGGLTADYLDDEDSTVTICPTIPGQLVTVTFTSFDTEDSFDGMYVFDGNSITAPQISSTNGTGFGPLTTPGAFWGTTIPGPFTSSSSTGCLTFRFRSDGSFTGSGWVANVTCAPAPTCLKPIDLTATNITSTSALLGWTDTNTTPATQWEVLYVPFGSPIPLPTATGVIVSANPSLITGLNPGTQYTFYVRAVCSSTDSSAWSSGKDFLTLIINDDCSGAIFAPVNSSAACQQITPGTITGATASTPGTTAPCIGNANDDVWFQFVATNTYLNISLQNVTGSTTDLNHAVYTGQCGTLTQLYCSTANSLSSVANNLVVGQTYFIRVYSNSTAVQTATFDLCISTPSTCPTGSTVCSLTNYANTTGVTSLGTIGCLFTSPNPAYFTIQVATTGPINYLLTQSSTAGGTPDLDVDYAAWGPFTSQAAGCAAISGGQAPGIGVPISLTTGCSYSGAATENLNIANAIAGQFYIVLITNFSDNPGFINLTQTNSTASGHGTTNCCPDAYFSYSPASYCRAAGNPNPIPTITLGSLAGTFSSTPGLVFVNTATGEIDLQASTPGNYVVTNTVAATASCIQFVKSYTINISEPTTATISYNNPSYCKSITSLQTVTQTGTSGGSYSAIPNVGLSINPTTGEINPSLSSAGVYTVVYGLPGSICTTGNPSTQVEIIALPNIVQPAPVAACYTYTLPSLAVGNYFSQTGGIGPLDIATPITNSQTIYIYAVGATGCINEKSFTVTINTVPTPTDIATTPSLCTPSTGTISFTALDASGPLPADLFISEVTDANAGSLTYVEIYNGTGATVNLSNYKLKIYNNGNSTTSCDLTLSGTMPNNTVKIISVGSATNAGGVIPDLVFAGCGGVNIDDNIRLTSAADVVIDLWGRTDGVAFSPLNQPGYTYRRLNSATLPSTTWNPADWTAIDPEDYTNVGSYSLVVSNYQYSVDSGAFQSGTTFSNLAAGDHILVVKDLTTGCLSAPITVTINAINPIIAVTGFSYTTPVCQNATPNPTPIPASGFTTGGIYSEDVTTTGLVFISTSTGEIDLANSTPGTHTVNYTVANQPAICLAGGQSSAPIEIKPTITPIIGFSYTTPICKNAQATLSPSLSSGFSSFATFSATPSGLVINATSGVIDLANSTPGVYDIVVTVAADSNTCRVSAITSPAFSLEIKPVITLVTGFNYDAPLCANNGSELPNLSAGFATGGTFSSTTGLTINSTTGAIDLTSTPGTYTVTYTANPNVNNCEVATPGTTQITIVPPVTIELTGGCQSVNYILTATAVNGSFNPETAAFVWHNSNGGIVGNTQSITVTEIGTYTVTITVDGCSTESLPFNVESVFCVIQKGISVNNDGLNDTFDLTGYDVKKLTIFNRLGMKVYSRNNYVNEWGGKSDDGDELPDGTYYFIIDRNNGETKTGWIYINRAQ